MDQKQKKTAILIGATGLIGGHILKILQENENYEKVIVLLRREVEINHPKVETRIIDFKKPEEYREALKGGETVFCSVGTTNKKVKGDKAAYREVDFDIPVNAARFHHENGGKSFFLVSSVGANSKGRNFYIRLKGEVEDEIRKIPVPLIAIFRPSLLLGERKESRFGESFAKSVVPVMNFMMPSKYKAVEARDVAKAMVRISLQNIRGFRVYHYAEMLEE